MRNSYDVIVVGAGPGGAATAMQLGVNGFQVALLERGPYPGSKNVFGGTVYVAPTAELVPAFWEEAPVERAVIADELWMLEAESVFKVNFTSLTFGKAPYNKFTVLRSNFDRWFAQQAVKAGAELHVNTLAVDLVRENSLIGQGKISGVRLDDGREIYADVVVLAEGVNAFLTEKAGLRKQFNANIMTLYSQEVLALPEGTINERFQLESGEGVTIGMLGYPMAETIGKGGLWTNKNTISLTVGGYLNQMVSNGFNPYLLMQRFKKHPFLKRLLAGAETVQYKAHLVPKGGYKYVPRLVDDGVVLVGDAAVMISGRRGTDLAMLSGKYAAETIVAARAKGDFSKKTLATYSWKLDNTFFMKDIKKGEHTADYYYSHPDSNYLVSKLINDVSHKFFTEGMITAKEKRDVIVKEMATLQLPKKTVADILAGMKYWGVQ